MRGKLFCGILVFVMAWPATASAQIKMEGFYGGAGLALQAVNKADDTGAAVTVRGGKRLDELIPHLSVEGEVTYSMVPSTFETPVKDYDVTVGSFALYGRYSYPVGAVTLEGRAGVSRVEADYGRYGSWSDIGPTLGVGVGYEVIDGLRGVAEYTLVQNDTWVNVSHLGITVEYTFY